MTLKTLDTVIALITVILLLSLIVQSIQSLVKKWLKLKSNTIQTSLEDLFKYVQSKDLAGIEASKLVGEVKEQFALLGRVSVFKRPMMDSIAKQDLLKILENTAISKVDPAKLDEFRKRVDTWFDTVMQSFEERYTRHMKTVAICISIVVVILLNANFFDIYQKISTNDSLRETVIAKREQIESRLKELKASDPSGATTKVDVDAALEALKGLQAEAPVFGFTPLTTQNVSDFYNGTGWQDTNRFWYLMKLIAGWAIMVMLLSVGAPFWQDTLESLFGVKNLLRKRTDTKNVEDKGGQTKP